MKTFNIFQLYQNVIVRSAGLDLRTLAYITHEIYDAGTDVSID